MTKKNLDTCSYAHLDVEIPLQRVIVLVMNMDTASQYWTRENQNVHIGDRLIILSAKQVYIIENLPEYSNGIHLRVLIPDDPGFSTLFAQKATMPFQGQCQREQPPSVTLSF